MSSKDMAFPEAPSLTASDTQVQERFPDFYIIGAPKCGTTSVTQYLARSDEVFIPSPGSEVALHCTDLTYLPAGRMAKTLDRQAYFARFAEAQPSQIVGTKPVSYYFSKVAGENLHLSRPDAKIIICIREPASFIASHHAQLLYNINEDTPNLWEALAKEDARRLGEMIPETTTIVEALFYREAALFSQRIQTFQKLFGKDRVLVMVLDDIKAAPRESERLLADFLGLRHLPEGKIDHANPRKVARYLGLKKFTRHPPPAVRALARKMPQTAGRVKRVLGRWNERTGVREAPDKEYWERMRLLNREFWDEIDVLGELLGRDLSHWKLR
jgi:hypothetical protein